jgi:ribosomal protein S18 acetylase RimI-like enzyme
MIELAEPDDRASVVDLWEACGLTRPWNDAGADFDRAVGGPSSAILVARVEHAIAGSVMVGFDGHRGWVYYLAVAPGVRRQGLGRRLMEAAEDWLRARGAPKIQLMVRDENEEALAFYDSLGLRHQSVVTLGRFLEEQE